MERIYMKEQRIPPTETASALCWAISFASMYIDFYSCKYFQPSPSSLLYSVRTPPRLQTLLLYLLYYFDLWR